MPPRLAVIIPCYNHAHYIGEALDSVLRQTRPPDRIIVIDDGSQDNSLEVMEPYTSRGVEVHGRENQGAHTTLNELVRLAAQDCDWISILNSDDRYLPDRFATCFRVADAQPGKSVISTRLEVIDGNGHRMMEDEPRARWFYGVQSLGDAHPDITAAEWLGRGNFIATTSNVFAKAEYLLANPFRPYRFNHDYFFLAGAAWRQQIALDPSVQMQYRVHGSNTISTAPEPLMREMLRMHLDLFHHYAAELAASPPLRDQFYRYMRALWDNISSCHAGMLHVMLAQLAARASETDIESLVHTLTGPEFDHSPNRSLAGAYDGTEPLSVGTLSRRIDRLRIEKERWQSERHAMSELARLKGLLMRSRWICLGNVLCLTRALQRNDGKGPLDKLDKLRASVHASKWVQIGAKIGSSACRQCLSS